MAPVSMNFGPQNCGAVPQMSVQDQGAARMTKDYCDFPMVLIFEQSVKSPMRAAIVVANWRGYHGCAEDDFPMGSDFLRSRSITDADRDRGRKLAPLTATGTMAWGPVSCCSNRF